MKFFSQVYFYFKLLPMYKSDSNQQVVLIFCIQYQSRRTKKIFMFKTFKGRTQRPSIVIKVPDLVITHFAKVGKTLPDKSGYQRNFNYFQSLLNLFNYQS
jgi:hypothetical protein